jgi:hypothetical protein
LFKPAALLRPALVTGRATRRITSTVVWAMA